MKNQTFSKNVFLVVMTLVLTIGVLGTAHALTTPPVSSTPADLSTLNMGSTITISGLTGRINYTGALDSLSINISGATFTATNPVTNTAIASNIDETWTEVDADNDPSTKETITLPNSVSIVTAGAGTLTVLVSWNDNTGTNQSITRTFFVVDTTLIAGNRPVISNGTSGGVDYGSQIRSTGAQMITITGDPGAITPNIPLTFSSTAGNIFVREPGPPIRESTKGRTPRISSTITGTASVMLDLSQTGTVTISHPSENSHSIVFISGRPTVSITGGNNQVGIANGRLEDRLSVTVRDSQNRPVSGVPVKFTIDAATTTTALSNQFIPVEGTTVYVNAARTTALSALIAGTHQTAQATSTYPIPVVLGGDMLVQTNSSGVAEVYLTLGTPGTGYEVYVDAELDTINNANAPATVSLLSMFRHEIQSDVRIPTIEIVSGNNQRADANGDIDNPLVVVVRESRQRIQGESVDFTTNKGFFQQWTDADNDNIIDAGETMATQSLTVTTNANGEAEAVFFLGDASGAAEVTATITGATPTVYTRNVTFNINGTGSSGGAPPPPQQQAPSLAITVTGTGTTRSVTVTALSTLGTPIPIAIPVTLSGSALTASQQGQQVNTGTATPITLPTTPGDYTLFATDTSRRYQEGSANITVAAPPTPGTLSIRTVGAPVNGQQTVEVSARDSNNAPAGGVQVTLTGTGISRTVTTLSNGSVRAILGVPTAASYTVTLEADGYTTRSVSLSAGVQPQQPPAQQPSPTGSQPPPPTISEPESVSIVGPSTRTGPANTQLNAPLLVQVLDDGGDAVEDARVIFRVREGRGRLSDLGNGRAVAVQTDSSGYARATYTPISASSTVEAEARGVTRTVTFTITGSGGTTPPTSRDTDTGTTPGTISPVVHVGAAQRPPMLWVDGGAIYALVGADVQRFAPSVDNALNIAVGGGKVYWTEQTGDSSGTVNSANLDGSGAKQLAESRFSVPMGIAVDTANKHLYWTNSSGNIKRASLNGKQGQNVLKNLQSPMDLALVGGTLYWTRNLEGQPIGAASLEDLRRTGGTPDFEISKSIPGTPMSIAIANGKIYWTAKTGDSSGTVNSANLDGSGAKQLADSRFSVPMGIAVDTARSRLYWTNSSGKIKRASLNGRQGHNAVDGLGMPGDMVLSNSLTAPTAAKPTTPTPTDGSAYDVNGDGTVDNTDAALVADAVGTNDPKSDVNGDGTVNFLDLLLVFDNREDGAAGAPTILGMKLSAVQVDRLQEQIDLLIATGDRSPAAMRTLIYLQQLIATARPEKTQLLANYPNPFNPETWIPYELATDTNVKITIYNTQGVVIRTLELGQQSAGYYTGRDRAAYWDGRNALGEQVASGIYFYQFETDDMSTMRKMVILK